MKRRALVCSAGVWFISGCLGQSGDDEQPGDDIDGEEDQHGDDEDGANDQDGDDESIDGTPILEDASNLFTEYDEFEIESFVDFQNNITFEDGESINEYSREGEDILQLENKGKRFYTLEIDVDIDGSTTDHNYVVRYYLAEEDNIWSVTKQEPPEDPMDVETFKTGDGQVGVSDNSVDPEYMGKRFFDIDLYQDISATEENGFYEIRAKPNDEDNFIEAFDGRLSLWPSENRVYHEYIYRHAFDDLVVHFIISKDLEELTLSIEAEVEEPQEELRTEGSDVQDFTSRASLEATFHSFGNAREIPHPDD